MDGEKVNIILSKNNNNHENWEAIKNHIVTSYAN